MNNHKNNLIQYRGGGYDGCFWEWNYFFVDNKGAFHDVYSSGRAGADTIEKAQEVLDTANDHVYKYDVTTEAAWTEINQESAKPNIQLLIAWFNDYDTMQESGIEEFALCTICDEKIRCASDIVLEDYRGCGGIAMTADTLICSECYTGWLCPVCSEFAGEGEIKEVPEHLQSYTQLCEDACKYCIEQAETEYEQTEHQDKLWSALTTGIPDLFSREMSWFWHTT